jgi:hypothetical protein
MTTEKHDTTHLEYFSTAFKRLFLCEEGVFSFEAKDDADSNGFVATVLDKDKPIVEYPIRITHDILRVYAKKDEEKLGEVRKILAGIQKSDSYNKAINTLLRKKTTAAKKTWLREVTVNIDDKERFPDTDAVVAEIVKVMNEAVVLPGTVISIEDGHISLVSEFDGSAVGGYAISSLASADSCTGLIKWINERCIHKVTGHISVDIVKNSLAKHVDSLFSAHLQESRSVCLD